MTNPIRKVHTTTFKTLRGQPHQPTITILNHDWYWYAICPGCNEQIRPKPTWVRTTRKQAKDTLYHHRKFNHCPAGPDGDSRYPDA